MFIDIPKNKKVTDVRCKMDKGDREVANRAE
jgi:hypothetical protein